MLVKRLIYNRLFRWSISILYEYSKEVLVAIRENLIEQGNDNFSINYQLKSNLP
jgi:hypothetical protein